MISASPDLTVYSSHSQGGFGLCAVVATVNDDTSISVPDLSAINEVELFSAASSLSQDQSEVPDPVEWTPKFEAKFMRLAQSKALNQLSFPGKVEFEKLANLRRQIVNPRTGEEVLAEYEQRMLTRNLLEALAKYVNWHKQHSQNRSG